MKIPKNDGARLLFYKNIVDVCLASRANRLELYAQWRAYYFFGAPDMISAWNLIYAHLDTVTSFLYASDSTRFSVRMGAKAPKADSHRTGPFAKLIMEEWKRSNADVIYQMGILWALVYDSTFIKHIRKKDGVYPYMVDPACFGVYREDVPMLDRQEAFVHVYYITQTDLDKRLSLHPRRREIMLSVIASFSKQDTSSQAPSFIDNVILTSGMPGVGSSPNVTGFAPNAMAAATPSYTAQIDVEMVEMQEIYVWNDDIDDYQVCTMAAGAEIIYDRQNIFMPRTRDFEGEHGFVQICPNPLPDYFWGQSEVSKLAPIQGKLNSRMDDIERLEDKQVDPPSAWGGMGISEDKMAAFNNPGAQIAIGDANFKMEKFIPQIPEHVYTSVERFQTQMDTVSGLPNVVQGKGEAGVRSAGHAGKLLTVGSSRAKKRGQIIEDSLEKGATIYGRVLYIGEEEELFDDNEHPFIPAQMDPHFFVDVDAHSNSPVFQDTNDAKADRLLKSKSITRERYIQMLAPPMQDELIQDLRQKIEPAEKKAAEAKAAEEAKAEAAKNGGHAPLKAVG